jgi:tetratricopeptide (TPR) repeat protein
VLLEHAKSHGRQATAQAASSDGRHRTSLGEVPQGRDRACFPYGPAWLVGAVCLFLAAITFAVFGQTLGHEFVNYDDGLYVYDNPAVVAGLSLKGIEWAFTHIVASNWQPLTMMSHMLDCQLYGLSPGGHHLTNVLLHTASVIVLFLVLRRMTGLLWRAAFVAAVFAIHPLRVESVAWVAERKDVLSGLFFMLTLWAYTRYAQKQMRSASPGPVPAAWFRSFDYYLVLSLFSLGLMCKPMLVTLPFVLLLLDRWPLRRACSHAGAESWPGSHLFVEKLPLLGLAVASCVVTILAQHAAIRSSEELALPLRVGNALISYVAYLRQMLWPSDLAVLYPLASTGVEYSRVVLSLVVLVGISAGCVVLGRRCPYLPTGWLWYFVMLLPVIGIVQVGLQARADRYTYLPEIGLSLSLTWAVAELCAPLRFRRVVAGGSAAIILGTLLVCARTQTSYWRNSELLWTHTLACTSENAVAHNDLGQALFQKKRVDEAIVHFQRALQIKSDYAEAHHNFGNALLQKGRLDEAMVQYQQALDGNPEDARSHNNLGYGLLQKKRVDEAIVHFLRALQIKPDYAEAHYNYGDALLQRGRAHEAIGHYQEALEIKPDSVGVLNHLAWLLATYPDAHMRGGIQAVTYAEHACELTHHRVPALLTTLAAAYAEAGRFDDAIGAAQEAYALARAAGEGDLLERNQRLLNLYRAHQAYREDMGGATKM